MFSSWGAVQLGIIKALYKQQSPNTNDYVYSISKYDENSDSDEDDQSESEESFHLETLSLEVELSDIDIQDLIDKIRKVIKIFRKVPTKNDGILQKYVKLKFAKHDGAVCLQ